MKRTFGISILFVLLMLVSLNSSKVFDDHLMFNASQDCSTSYILNRKAGAVVETVTVFDSLGNYHVWYSRCVFGKSNFIDNAGWYSTIAGGLNDTITAGGDYGFIGGGENNELDGHHCGIIGGQNNKLTGSFSFIGGGYGNTGSSNHSAMCGTYNCNNNSQYTFIGGGRNHDLTKHYCVALGGSNIDLGSHGAFGFGYNCLTRGATRDSACGVFGVGAIVDSCLATIAFNCQIKKQDSIFAIAKAIWVMGPTDTNKITPTGISSSLIIRGSDSFGAGLGTTADTVLIVGATASDYYWVTAKQQPAGRWHVVAKVGTLIVNSTADESSGTTDYNWLQIK